MDNNEILVTVTGKTGVGKSAIAQEISDHLTQTGFSVRLRFIDDEHTPRDPVTLSIALESIRESGVSIAVNEEKKL